MIVENAKEKSPWLLENLEPGDTFQLREDDSIWLRTSETSGSTIACVNLKCGEIDNFSETIHVIPTPYKAVPTGS